MQGGAGTGSGNKNYAGAPEHYDGEPSKYESWRNSLMLYLVAVKGDYNKIIATLSYLTKETAATWQKGWQDRNRDALYAGHVRWTDFLEEMDQHFHDPRQAERARKDLFRMKIGFTEEFRNFLVKFDDMRQKAKMNDPQFDPQLVEYLMESLPHSLTAAIDASYATERELNNDNVLQDWTNGRIVDPDEFRERMKPEIPTYERYSRIGKAVDRAARPQAYELRSRH